MVDGTIQLLSKSLKRKTTRELPRLLLKFMIKRELDLMKKEDILDLEDTLKKLMLLVPKYNLLDPLSKTKIIMIQVPRVFSIMMISTMQNLKNFVVRNYMLSQEKSVYLNFYSMLSIILVGWEASLSR